MLMREVTDPTIYEQFKDYGRGHLKLLKLHVDNLINEQESPSEGLVAYQQHLEQEVNADVWEEWQDIRTDATFSKQTVRDMAKAVGMEREYRFLYAPASSTSHGEWYGLDRYVLTRCLNPAHGLHRTLREDTQFTFGRQLVVMVIDLAKGVASEYMRAYPLEAPPSSEQGQTPSTDGPALISR